MLAAYLRKRRLVGPWCLQGRLPSRPLGAVVIPALAEGAELFATLDSLDRCTPELRRRFAVVVVVNRSAGSDPGVAAVNAADLQRLARRGTAGVAYPLAWVDASSPGGCLPERHAGVGMARKLGCDLLLEALSEELGDPLLASLDADTQVAPDYLWALVNHFADGRRGGCVIPFRHRDAGERRAQEAVERYELYLRSYVQGLACAGSPYAYHAVGSAMACSASAYLRAGGMNRRKGGEDFYFLQQLAKTSRVEPLRGTQVYPSPRASQRAPFGTGRVVARQLAGDRACVRYHAPEAYALLGEWLRLVEGDLSRAGEALLRCADGLHARLGAFLRENDFVQTWQALQGNFRCRDTLLRAFHAWFDGLRTLRLLHALEEVWPSSPDAQTVAWQMGWEPSLPEAEMLARLRRLQGVVD